MGILSEELECYLCAMPPLQNNNRVFQRDIAGTLNESFDCCISELGPYADTAREFSELPDTDSSSMHAETDVDSLQTKLSALTDQQTLAKGIKDAQNVSIFRADFRPLKRIILPNISKVSRSFQVRQRIPMTQNCLLGNNYIKVKMVGITAMCAYPFWPVQTCSHLI